MEQALFYLAAFTCLVCAATALIVTLGSRSIRHLCDQPLPEPSGLPRVSIIVPARNEERNIEAGVRSLLAFDYDDYELLVVNDRSTDRTGEILNRIAAENSRLQVVHLTELPAGWLGKNHAMYLGAERATGEYLLFTDADVVMEPTTLRRAVGFAREHGLDHLPLSPEVRMPSWLLEAFVIVFTVFFSAYFRPWNARKPRSRCYVGIGAFNLLRADAYRKMGTLEAIRMRPDDDVMLGKLVKKNGFRQELLNGVGQVWVPWYGSLREVVVGLEKNAFSGVDYRVTTIVWSSAMSLTCNVGPFLLVWLTGGLTQGLNAASMLIMLGLAAATAGGMRLRRSAALGFPLVVLLFVYIQWRAMFLTLWNNGIRWRDTHYSLAELKANRV